MHAWVALQPAVDLRRGVRGGVIEHNVQGSAGVGLDQAVEERDEFLVGVLGVAGAGDLAGRDLQRGVEAGGPVAL
jgi:hypothetical protein